MGGLLFHIIIPSFALLFGFHAHKQIIFLQYKRSSPIVKNDGASHEHMLQNTLILRGFYISAHARLLFVAVSLTKSSTKLLTILD